ncbi:hypothetical protein WX45_02718 [Clostridium ljungdahlii DSM 13528]|uniref:Uncharacterized protein n=1 Tax=Clostridium ljungdahlii (strain ATCC 55383 / DSM 13528 / PETC) TaxID=748727 RepID=D8GKG0_CLOLD|nr:hypothetical protein [Clostridium ljungdahlii]ADK15300.1 conserved hypothetical protein [Clostridium ljungdahlii DSM 13528]OAA88783.1 hypothetical protein WX45_02718 [Clostridium ljungdahlii DSM 13528]
MKFSRKGIVILSSFIIIIGGFIISHITPSISIRTYIFVSGYSVGAFKGTVHVNKGQYNMDKNILDKENAVIYTIVGYNLYDKATGNLISNYKVRKIGLLYFTEDYGEC